MAAALAGALPKRLLKGRPSGRDFGERATPMCGKYLKQLQGELCLVLPGAPDTGDWGADPARVQRPQPVDRTKVSGRLLTAEDPEGQRSERADLKAPRNLAAGWAPNSGLCLQHPGTFGDLGEGPGQELWT